MAFELSVDFRGLVVVGSPATLSSDPNWQSWIHWVQEHGCFLTPTALPHSRIEQVSISTVINETLHLQCPSRCVK